MPSGRGGDGVSPRGSRVPRWQGPAAPICDTATGRVPCLNQSSDFASLDLSVLFITSSCEYLSLTRAAGPYRWRFVLWCFATQPCKAQNS